MSLEQEKNGLSGHWLLLDRHISIGNILTTLTATVAIVMWVMTLSGRVDVLEKFQAVQSTLDRRQDEEQKAIKAEMLGEFRHINDKLDRLIERNGKGG